MKIQKKMCVCVGGVRLEGGGGGGQGGCVRRIEVFVKIQKKMCVCSGGGGGGGGFRLEWGSGWM